MPEFELRRIPEDTGGRLSADVTVLNGVAYTTVIPVDADGVLVDGAAAQCELVFDELERELKRAGSGLDRLVHLTIYLCDIERLRPVFNEVYAQRLAGLPVPVRCAVGVAALARPGMLVELTAVARAG